MLASLSTTSKLLSRSLSNLAWSLKARRPEEWRQTIAALHSTVGTIIQKRLGTVVQYLGDGLLALFGAQGSSEYDIENAVRAALDAQSAVASLNAPHPIQIRIGIHTGLVVVATWVRMPGKSSPRPVMR